MSELESMCKEVLKTELKVSEQVEEIEEMYTREEIEEAMLNVMKTVLDNVEDPMREVKICKLCVQWGQSFNSTKLVEFGKVRLQEWQEKHG